ncbi:LysE family translocator [Phreatobacter stygius]|uniref:LysE family translocator n=1 Tax=Phreatobacter stygius TaxID=1940610 RepID=A0A4D7B5A8_9HYPH|nr:LysE family translocator [Phreatobacter stygius]QCI66173.1 LysE family translocator [Phreatobacter stygius]
MPDLLSFMLVSIVVIVVPGPDTAVALRNTLFGGRAAGVSTALGIAAGQVVWALAASAGMVAVLVASEPLFLAVKYAGAAYLVWLGIQALREAFRPSPLAPGQGGPRQPPQRRITPSAACRQGLVSDLGNPKMAVFFSSLLPQFVPAGGETFSALLFLGLVFALMTFLWLALYAALVARLGDVLRLPGVRRTVEAVTGVLLVGLGLRIAAEQR